MEEKSQEQNTGRAEMEDKAQGQALNQVNGANARGQTPRQRRSANAPVAKAPNTKAFAGKLSVQDITTVGVFTAMTAVFSQIVVVLPFIPVPISFGQVSVYICGMLLLPSRAMLAQVCFLLLGAVGLPVFGEFKGGLGALFGPTGGYLLTYPIMAGMVSVALNSRVGLGLASRYGKPWIYASSSVSIIAAHLLLYSGGTAWLAFSLEKTFSDALLIGVKPFVLLDALKIILCVMIVVPLRSRLAAARSRSGARSSSSSSSNVGVNRK
jgi:biotin transport system substrate-specific component